VAAELNILGLLIAALGGAAVGVEREWSGHADGPGARFAGLRTFTMLGGIGGLSGSLGAIGYGAASLVLLAGTVAIIAAGYIVASRVDIDGTTEIAALVVVGAGILSGIGAYRVGSGIIALTSLVLIEKSRLHALVRRVDDVGLRSGVRFAVMALVILPLLPQGPYGPLGGVRPRELWALVLFFSGLSFLGYVARRHVGATQGYFVTGVLGGLVSSTNVTLTFARLSRTDSTTDRSLAFGALAANAMLYPRVMVATAVLNIALVPDLAAYLAMPGLFTAAVALIGMRQSGSPTTEAPAMSNPLQLGAALQMAAMFQVVLMLVQVARSAWGQAGILSSAAILGLTDVDALTVSMARGMAHSASVRVAAFAIAVGILSNALVKLAITLFFGGARYRRIVGAGLLLMILAAAASLAVRGI
jgi:uncharacterized membrane protein (DUF4010 family)